MNQNRGNIDFLLGWSCLFVCLIFPVMTIIPGINYLAQIGAVFSVLYFAFRGRFIYLIAGTVGSLLLGIWVFGFSLNLLGHWAIVIIPAIGLGRLLTTGMSSEKSLIISMIIAVLISMALFFIEKDMINQGIDNLTNTAMELVSENGSTPVFFDEFNRIMSIIKRLMPSFLALSAVSQLALAWLGLTYILGRYGEFVPGTGKFIYWKMPYYLIYPLGVVITLRLLGNNTIEIIADNTLLFVGFFYAVFGFSVIEYFLKKIRLSLFMRILFYIGFILLQLPGLIFAAVLGLFDSYFDFRKVRARIIG
jgi:hypothetical protein